MSETGATAERLYRACPACQGTGEKNNAFEAEWDSTCSTCEGDGYLEAQPGYQITKAGAVTLSAEEAELGADGLSRLIARYESLANEHDRAGRTEQWLWERNNAAKYRALAAKLGGAS